MNFHKISKITFNLIFYHLYHHQIIPFINKFTLHHSLTILNFIIKYLYVAAIQRIFTSFYQNFLYLIINFLIKPLKAQAFKDQIL